jgi:hypothetical protein
MKRIAISTLVAIAATAAGCGGGDDKSPRGPVGSVDNPVVARTEPDAESAPKEGNAPGYAALLDQQSSKPRSRFSPCNLVTPEQARSFLREAVRVPVEAPQGPTCLYRTKGGDRMVTLAVQAVPFDRMVRQVRDRQRLRISRRAAVCGTFGQSVVFVELPRRRVLSVAAPCAIGLRFAAAALRRLS